MLATAARPVSADRPWVPLPPQAAGILATVLRLKIQDAGLRFQCDGEDCTAEMGLPDGLLPLLVWEAGKLMETLRGKMPPLGFHLDEKALLGVVVDFSAPTESVGIWALHMDYVLDAWVKDRRLEMTDKQAPIPMDRMFQEWLRAQDRNVLPIRARPSQEPSRRPG
jgi:hypothetical protein